VPGVAVGAGVSSRRLEPDAAICDAEVSFPDPVARASGFPNDGFCVPAYPVEVFTAGVDGIPAEASEEGPGPKNEPPRPVAAVNGFPEASFSVNSPVPGAAPAVVVAIELVSPEVSPSGPFPSELAELISG
jgi:hypothetical protein